jgi:hypothetical protein
VPEAEATAVAALFCSAEAAPIPHFGGGDVPPGTWERKPDDPPGPPFFAVDLVSTKKLPGSARAVGTGHVTFASSPFGVALAPDGSYVYDVSIQLQGLEPPDRGVLVAWLTTTQVDRVERLGTLDADLSVRGQVDWNKFLVVVTLESSDDPHAAMWSGPIVMRGVSRSGLMHTMAGHGPFQQELCAKYGYR